MKEMKHMSLILVALALILGVASGEQCGSQAGGALCPNGLCCSQYGYCGSTSPYCGTNCQSQCTGAPPPPPPSGGGGGRCGTQGGGALCSKGLCCSQYGYCGSTSDYCSGTNCQSQCPGAPPPPPPPPPSAGGGGNISSVISSSMFDQMLNHRNDPACEANGFYTYSAFITAAKSFTAFGTTGDATVQKREIAAFFGQTSHETTGGWPSAPGGPYAWGYCYIRETNRAAYCEPSQGPCAAGKLYYGRGPIQLTHNYNYQQAGNAIGVDLINNPDLVATDAVISFKVAIWFWMTAQGNKPSSHDVITGSWTPSAADTSAGRVPGYGVITNIINGGLECGIGPDSRVADRIGFYKRYCDMFGVGYGNNLDCYTQTPF